MDDTVVIIGRKGMSNLSSNNKSRMKGDFHVRFCGNVEVKFLRVTRLAASRVRVQWTKSLN